MATAVFLIDEHGMTEVDGPLGPEDEPAATEAERDDADERDEAAGRAGRASVGSVHVESRESGVSEETLEEMRTAYPVARHPIVRTHPDTG